MPSSTRIRQGIAARADLAGNFLVLPASLNLAMNLYCKSRQDVGQAASLRADCPIGANRRGLQIPRRLPEKFIQRVEGCLLHIAQRHRYHTPASCG